MKSIIKAAAAVLVLAIGFSAASCGRDEQRAGNTGGGVNTGGDAALTAQVTTQAEPAAPVLAQAQPAAPAPAESPAADFAYRLTSDGQGIVITGFRGHRGANVIIPAMIEDMPVREIGSEAFRNTSVRTVVVPDTVEIIRAWAFMNIGASSITLSDSIRVIEQAAFSDSRSLTTINLPANLEEIHRGAFSNLPNLTELIIPDTLSSVSFVFCPVAGENRAFGSTIWGSASFERLPIRTRQAIRNLGYTDEIGL